MTNKTNFNANDGRSYEILTNDDGTEIAVAQNNEVLGSISLNFLENSSPDSHYYYRITHLALDGCPPCIGIGRACLQHHRVFFNKPIIAGIDGGPEAIDGSHLTGSGSGFIKKMIKEGLVTSSDTSRWARYDKEE